MLITGVFEAYPVRAKLAAALKLLGAKVKTSVSKKLNIVLMGRGSGLKKMEKIEDLLSDGYDIRVMGEEELQQLMKEE